MTLGSSIAGGCSMIGNRSITMGISGSCTITTSYATTGGVGVAEAAAWAAMTSLRCDHGTSCDMP
jgi:hypothetical protein